MIITIQDCASKGYCVRGMRAFAKKHKLSWIDFVKKGIDDKVLESTKDGMALAIIERVKNGQKEKTSNRN